MALQQAAGLHPFVSKVKIVDPTFYPEIQLKTIQALEWCPVVITDDFNMYTVTVTIEGADPNIKTIRLIKLQRQDFHENYFTAETATLPGLIPVEYTIEMGEYKVYPILTFNPGTDQLFLLYNTLDGMVLRAYTVVAGPHDVTVSWNSKTLFSPPTDLDKHGMFIKAGNVSIYNLLQGGVEVQPFQIATGNGVLSYFIDLDQTYSYLKIIDAFKAGQVYVLVRTGNIIRMATCILGYPSIISAFVQITSASGFAAPTEPSVMAFTITAADPIQMCSVINGFNNDINNILQIAYIKVIDITTSSPAGGMETPFIYNLNKFQLFSEVSNPSQNDMIVAITVNPNNPNFYYIVYLAGTNQLRVVKMYRNKVINTTYETHVPLVMWGTRLGAIGDSFKGNVSLVADIQGNIYVYISGDGTINVWKIKEYIIDLGHTESTVVAPVDTVTNMLEEMTNEYTILTATPNVHVANFPNVNDVTIDTIVNNGTNINIDFQYINYDYLQVFKTVVSSIKTLVNNTFITLYQDSALAIVNLNPDDTDIAGDNTSLSVQIPVGSAKKPCVVKGTQVIVAVSMAYKLVNIENIKVGDLLLNQLGKPVKVIDHLITTVQAQEHNAPYLIPVDFFGSRRPYKPLLISGDHGIMASIKPTNTANSSKVVYAEDIKVLKQVLIGNTVEYHHLLLENHMENFFIANGLEIDSYHPGFVLKSRS